MNNNCQFSLEYSRDSGKRALSIYPNSLGIMSDSFISLCHSSVKLQAELKTLIFIPSLCCIDNRED